MSHTFTGSHTIGTGASHTGIIFTGKPGPSHATGQVDNHVGIAGAHCLHHLAKQLNIAGALLGLGVTHVDMGHRGPGFGRRNNGLSHLLRCHGNIRVFMEGFTCAGHRTGDNHIIFHNGLCLCLLVLLLHAEGIINGVGRGVDPNGFLPRVIIDRLVSCLAAIAAALITAKGRHR